MKAELKNIVCDDFDLENFSPDNENYFSVDLLLSIGLENEKGSDYYRLNVCSPECLVNTFWVPKILRHVLLMRSYDLERIKKIINEYVESCEGNSYVEISEKLSRFFAWEFEDYQPFKG